ncbi:MAG: hypothetical protein KatS3mg129_2898 [Leptospiraceae bacterium]|nr:MAG: hypothetical protein KatS3mg129_2898 [Leptospiraceae bacterium]
MQRYIVGIIGSILHLTGLIFICTSFYLLPENYWGYFLIFAGLFFIIIDGYFLYQTSKSLQETMHFINLFLIDGLVILFFIILWFIEVPALKDNKTFWNNLRTFFIFLFLLSLFIHFIYRNIVGYHYYNQLYQKTAIKISSLKIISQSIFLVLVLFLINLLLIKWDLTIDLTPGYYSFSKKTKDIIASIKSQNIKIFVFLPDQQLVQTKKDTTVPEIYNFSEELKIMFSSISKINPEIEVQFYNADLLENNNQSFGNVTNGTIILRNYSNTQTNLPYTERRIYVFSSYDLEKLEQNFIRSLLQIASEPIKVYFSTGFGERYINVQKKPYNIDYFIDVLRIYNFEIFEWNEAKGFPYSIPEDTQILVFAGSQYPIPKDTQKVILDYLTNKNGKLLIMIDPNGKENFNWLLESLNLNYRFHIANLLQIERKPNFIYTDQIGIMDLTQNIRNIERPRILFTARGYFDKINQLQKISDYIVKEFLFTTYTTWNDVNQNLKKDKIPEENNKRFTLGIAIEKENSKIVLYSDVDWITNKYLIQNIYNLNLQLATDTLFYLGNRMNIPGILEEKRENQNILIDESGKVRLFIIGIIIIPLSMIILVGLLVYFYNKKHKITL